MEISKGIGVWYCDTEEELDERLQELDSNPDFTHVGDYDMLQDMYDELNYQDFTDEQIESLSHQLYGNCLDILEYSSQYYVYIGAS